MSFKLIPRHLRVKIRAIQPINGDQMKALVVRGFNCAIQAAPQMWAKNQTVSAQIETRKIFGGDWN